MLVKSEFASVIHKRRGIAWYAALNTNDATVQPNRQFLPGVTSTVGVDEKSEYQQKDTVVTI